MDASFDGFAGGGGWGGDQEQGDHDMSMSTQTHQPNKFDKVPIPLMIKDLALVVDSEEEQYKIRTYIFRTVRTIGKVCSMTSTDANGTTTYELCDVSGDIRTSKRFTVIHYEGIDDDEGKDKHPPTIYQVGSIVHIIGKLRLFNTRMSLLSFNIREVVNGEINTFETEVALAKIFYEKGIPDMSPHELKQTLWVRKPPGTVDVKGLSLGGNAGAFATPNRPAPQHPQQSLRQTQMAQSPSTRPPMQTQNSTSRQTLYQPSQGKTRHLSQQQKRIYDFLNQNGRTESGVRDRQIKEAIRGDDKFGDDLNAMLSEGVIYTTVDDEHYSLIDH